MAPSIAENVADIIDHGKEKLASISVKENKPAVEATEETAPAVQAAPVGETPSPAQDGPAIKAVPAQSQHRGPLKLSGALDKFESFDVTPTIGREFAGVNLAEWLKATNSDELLRDLAITSKFIHLTSQIHK
jgi:hypothetical protein